MNCDKSFVNERYKVTKLMLNDIKTIKTVKSKKYMTNGMFYVYLDFILKNGLASYEDVSKRFNPNLKVVKRVYTIEADGNKFLEGNLQLDVSGIKEPKPVSHGILSSFI